MGLEIRASKNSKILNICYRVNKRSQTSRKCSLSNWLFLWLYAVTSGPHLCGTYGYNDYSPPCRSNTPPLWVDPKHPWIMPLPSCDDQRVNSRHMHIVGTQSGAIARPLVILGQSEPFVGTQVGVYSYALPSSVALNCVIQMHWKWFNTS